MLSLGMRLPRKITGQNKDTTCTCVDVFCVILMNCVFGVHALFHV